MAEKTSKESMPEGEGDSGDQTVQENEVTEAERRTPFVDSSRRKGGTQAKRKRALLDEIKVVKETCQAHEIYESNGSKQPAHNGETLTRTDKMTEMTAHTVQIHLCESDLTKSNEFQASLRKRVLPSGTKYHVFFCYAILDIEWVRETVHTLETEYGFVCCEFDRDNTPGTSLLQFASDGMKKAYKTVIVMTRKAFQSSFVIHEIQMALNRGFSKGKTFVVPVLLEDCEIPDYLSVLHYIDARDSKRRDIWWPKLVMELDAPGRSLDGTRFGPQEDRDSSSTSYLGRFICGAAEQDCDLNPGELHRTVLNRCLPQLLLDLDIASVLLYIQQKELFGDVTLRDISEQKTTSDKIKELIQVVKQGGPKAYEMFKECLVETKQTTLLEQLEHQEA